MASLLAGLGFGGGDWTVPAYDPSAVLDIDAGTPRGEPAPVKADPHQEYVVSGPEAIDRSYLHCERGYGGPLAWHGVAEYERMYHTPVVASSVNALRCAVLANPINLLPAVTPRSITARPGQRDGSQVEADLAAEVCESNRRMLAAWDTPIDEVLWESMEDIWLGHMLAEVVADDVGGGPDAGLLAIRAVKWKPRSTYQFRVDQAMNVVGIKAMARVENGGAEWKAFDPDHFAWTTNDPYRGDPRGRSSFRMAHYHWRLLMDLWPEIMKGWIQFGVPCLWGTTAPNAAMVPRLDESGGVIAGRGMTAERAQALTLQGLRNGKVGVGPHGSDAKVLESSKDSSVVAGAITVLQAQIIETLLLQTRATKESENGSKADSVTAQDVMGTLVRFQRKRRERFLRSLLMRQNTWNYGPDIARRATPLADLGGTEHQDFAANSSGVATLFQSSFFTKNQLPSVDTFLGLPQRQPGDERVGPNGTMPDAPAADPNAPAPTDPAPPPADQANETAPAEGVGP